MRQALGHVDRVERFTGDVSSGDGPKRLDVITSRKAPTMANTNTRTSARCLLGVLPRVPWRGGVLT